MSDIGDIIGNKMATEAKRARTDGRKQNKGKSGQRNYYAEAQKVGWKRSFLQPGQRGFFVTCNGREKDCIRECYRLLNEYADQMYGKVQSASDLSDTVTTDDKSEENVEEEEDISVLVQKQAEAVKQEKQEYRFQSVDTSVRGSCFITTTLKDPKELALSILHDLNVTKKAKSRTILRMMPIEVVTRANLKDIINAAGNLFDKYFIKDAKTYAIIFNRRFNNDIERDAVITELASLVTSKNVQNKANLKNPDLAIIVEVVKGLCLISVIPEYFQLRKYNLTEICSRKESNPEGEKNVTDKLEVDSGKEIDEEATSTAGTEDSEKEVDTGETSAAGTEKVSEEEVNASTTTSGAGKETQAD